MFLFPGVFLSTKKICFAVVGSLSVASRRVFDVIAVGSRCSECSDKIKNGERCLETPAKAGQVVSPDQARRACHLRCCLIVNLLIRCSLLA